MSHLSKERVTPLVTFEKVGVDLWGPFSIKASPLAAFSRQRYQLRRSESSIEGDTGEGLRRENIHAGGGVEINTAPQSNVR